jgi:hypothetical protein
VNTSLSGEPTFIHLEREQEREQVSRTRFAVIVTPLTPDDKVLFVWNQSQFKATLPLTSYTNVGLLRSAPGHLAFANFVGTSLDTTPSFFASTLVTDDKADSLDADCNDDDDSSLHLMLPPTLREKMRTTIST